MDKGALCALQWEHLLRAAVTKPNHEEEGQKPIVTTCVGRPALVRIIMFSLDGSWTDPLTEARLPRVLSQDGRPHPPHAITTPLYSGRSAWDSSARLVLLCRGGGVRNSSSHCITRPVRRHSGSHCWIWVAFIISRKPISKRARPFLAVHLLSFSLPFVFRTLSLVPVALLPPPGAYTCVSCVLLPAGPPGKLALVGELHTGTGRLFISFVPLPRRSLPLYIFISFFFFWPDPRPYLSDCRRLGSRFAHLLVRLFFLPGSRSGL